MNFVKSKKIALVSSAFLLIMAFFINNPLYAMDVAELATEGLRAELPEISDEVITEAANQAAEEFENLSAEEISQLSPDLQRQLEDEIDAMAKKLKAEVEEAGGKLDIESEEFKNILNETRTNFVDDITKQAANGFSEQTRSVLEQFPEVGEVVDKAEIIPNDVEQALSEQIEVSVKPKFYDLDKANDAADAAETKLKEAYKKGNPDEINTAQKQLNDAKEAYNKQSEDLKNKSTDSVIKSRQDLQESQYNLDNTKTTGDETEIKKAKDTVIEKKSDVKAAEQDNQELIKKQADQEYDQAKAAKQTADEKLEYTKKIFKDDPEKIEAAQKEVNDKQTALDTAKKTLLDNSGWLENNSIRLGDAAQKSGSSFWEGIKKTGGLAWEHVGQGFLGGFIFTFPNMIMDSIESYFRNKTLIDSYLSIQTFGKVLIRIPSSLINTADPVSSKFVYVGVPNKDQSLDAEFLKTANYYVSKSDYGPVAAYAVNDPSFPGVMLHLNTGLVFVGDGQPYDQENITIPLLQESSKEQNLAQILNDLSGEVSHGAQGKTYQYYQIDRSTGYKGDPTIGALFATPSDKSGAYPPVLNAAITALQNGTQFGKFSLQGIRGLGTDKNMLQLLSPDSQIIGAPDEPYVAQGIYVYQTKDTPFITNIRNSLAPDDPDQQIILKDLSDYVVMLNENAENAADMRPLMVPESQLPYNYASYTFNAVQVKYMLSLLNGALYIATSLKPSGITAPPITAKDIAGIDQHLVDQITLVQAYCQQHAMKGPFSYGSVSLTIDPKLLAVGAFIYKVPGYLAGGVDDYVVALKGTNALELPSQDVQFFVSLVTSRFYDKSFNPYSPPRHKTMSYNIATLTGKTTPFITTGPLTGSMKGIYSGKAPLYTLFMEYPFNPNNPPAGTNITESQLSIAFAPYWALNHLTLGSEAKPPLIIDYLKESNPALLTMIQTSHDAWVKTLDKNDPAFISKQMGPFDFTTDLVDNVHLKAVSEDAIKNQNYVYVSNSYPDDYLVMSEDAQGTTVGHAFSTQQYAISLSNGTVYDAKPQGATLSGSKVEQDPLNVDEILKKAQSASPYIPDLLKKIQNSQIVYNGTLLRNLFGPDTGFGRFKLYINKTDYLSGQFIYADVTNLGDPLDASGNEVASVVSAINDYYVCVERTADTAQAGGYSYSFGSQLSANTYSVVSLVSGASYDRTGKYLGSYAQYVLQGGQITDILGFTNQTLGIIAQKSGKPVRLLNTIRTLTQSVDDAIKQEQKQIADELAEQQRLYAPLGANLIADLKSLPYVDNPNLLPRYLKYYQGNYYASTPGYVFTTPPSADIPVNTPGPDTTYINYNLGVGKDSGKGMMYDSNGNAQLLLTGWALTSARAYAGVVVDASGNQKRMVGVTTPTLPMGTTAQPDAFLVSTGFPTQKSGSITFDFYYHTQVDSYFVKISTNNQQYYVNLTSGYGYNLDGTPRWFESPLYKDKYSNLLLVGTDAFDIRKVALRRPTPAGQPQQPYSFYTMVGSFKAKIMQDYKAQGSYYEMVSDIDPDQRIRLMYCQKDLNGVALPTPYYLVWDVSQSNQFNLIGQYLQDKRLRYSLLIYAQTRAQGASVETGSFIPADNYIDPSATPLKPKTVGIIFDYNQAVYGIFYQNQMCMFKGGTTSSYIKTNQDGTQTTQPISVIQNQLKLQPGTGPVMAANWLSINDGAYTYDYVYDYLILNPEPEVSSGDETASHLNLYQAKQKWQLNASSFVPSSKSAGVNLTKPASGSALVSQLNATKSPGTLQFAPNIAESLKSKPNENLQYINLDDSGSLFINNRVSGKTPTKRFAYTLGQAQDASKNYYAPVLNGWSVDLSNGILYDDSGFPSGQSLMPVQLSTLLDVLQVSVGYDAAGVPHLQFRMALPPSASAKK
jgi:hypothetical protein